MIKYKNVWDKDRTKIVYMYDYSNVPDNKCKDHGKDICFGGFNNAQGIPVWKMPDYVIERLNDKDTCQECMDINEHFKRMASEAKVKKGYECLVVKEII